MVIDNFDVEINRSPRYLREVVVSDRFLDEPTADQAIRTMLYGTGFTYHSYPNGGKVGYWIRAGETPTDTVNGTVITKDEMPIAGVSIASLSTGRKVVTDEKGSFRIGTMLHDTLILRAPGWQSQRVIPIENLQSIKVTLTGWHGVKSPIDVRGEWEIKSSNVAPEENLIAPPKTILSVWQAGNKLRMNGFEKSMALSGMGEVDALRATESLPGISMTGESVGNLNIRGGEGDQNLLLFDGIPIYHSQHMFGLVGMFNNRAVSHVDAMPGHFEARYGRRTSGVIALEGRPGHPYETQPSFSYGANLLSMSLSGEMPLAFGNKEKPPVAIMVAVRRSFSDLWFSPVSESLLSNRLQSAEAEQEQALLADSSNLRREIAEPRFYFWDANLKLVWAMTERQQLSVTAFNGHDRLDYRVNRKGLHESHLENLHLNNQGISLIWRSQWKISGRRDSFQPESSSALTVSGYRNLYTYQYQGADFEYQQAVDNQINESTFRHGTSWRIDANHHVEAGIEWSELGVGKGFRSTRVNRFGLLPDTSGQQTARIYSHFGQYSFFWPYRLAAEGFWRATLGLRHSYYNQDRQHYWEPRVELSRTFEDGLKLHATWGQYYQFVRQLRANNDINVGEQIFALAGADDVPVLQARHGSVGGSYALGNAGKSINCTFSLDGYLKTYQGLAMYGYGDGWVSDGEDPQSWLTDGSGWVRGLDAMIKYESQWLEGWVSYSLSQGVNQFSEINEGTPFAAATDQRHQVSVVNTISFPTASHQDHEKWVFSSNFTYASGRPFTPLEGYEQQGFLTQLNYADVHSARLPDYHRLDLSFHYNHSFGLGQSDAKPPVKGKIGMVVYNVYNRANVGRRRYRIPEADQGATSAPLVIDHQLLGISPNFFINLEF
jgi:hypothetical protein